MLSVLTRRVIYPLHERFLGRRTFHYWRELERSQWLAPDDVRALQHSKLKKLLIHAEAKIPFYRERFRRAAVNVRTDDPIHVLRQLPLLDKGAIRAAGREMLWRDAPGGWVQRHTGGSTGEPLMFFLGRRRQGYDQAARIRSHRWFGVEVGDRELYLWGSPIELSRGDGIKRLRDALFNQRLVSAFNMSPQTMDRYLAIGDRFRPACWFGYPSSLALLADHAHARGHRLDNSGLRAVFVTGEVCYPPMRRIIQTTFGVPVSDGYGSREAGFIAHECPQGRMHLTAESVVVEIVGPNGRLLPPGESGEIVVTHLDAYAMPFIRYRTGDVGRLKPGRCDCGRGLPMMDVVEGRTTDFLVLPDGTIQHALSIIYPLRAMRGIRQFRVIQQEDYSIAVEVVADDALERITPEAVTRRVGPVIGQQVDLHVRLVDHICGEASGKHRYVVSHVQAKHEVSSAAVEAR